MWQRSQLKEQAKFHLKGKYWMAFLVALIMGILAGEGGGGIGTSFNSFPTSASNLPSQFSGTHEFSLGQDSINSVFQFLGSPVVAMVIAFAIVIFVFVILYRIFVAAPIRVGGMRWFSRSRESEHSPSISQLFSLFSSGQYMGSVKGIFWQNLWLWLWGLLSTIPMVASLLFLIIYNGLVSIDLQSGNFAFNFELSDLNLIISAGVMAAGILLTSVLSIIVTVKKYSYQLVPWILADNPAIGARKALNLSKKLTRGHKFNMFVLDLSFIGWYLLGLLACCIGVIFVTPYHLAAQTELYAALRDIGVDKGAVSMEELGYQKISTGI